MIHWTDLTVTVGMRYHGVWKDSKGQTRIFASLKNASFVNHTFWLLNPDINDPTTKAVILLEIHRVMVEKRKALAKYELRDYAKNKETKD